MRRSIKWSLRVIAATAIFVGFPASASVENGAYIVDLNVDRLGDITVKTSNAQTGGPTCATNGYWNYEFQNSTSSGAMLSVIMTAYYDHKIIYFNGGNACSIDSTVEDLLYVRL